MEVSFFNVGENADARRSEDLGSWEMPAIPRVGEEVLLPGVGGDRLNITTWIVLNVVHDVARGGVTCEVATTAQAAHRLAIVWSASLPEPPYALPRWLDCDEVPRVGDCINLETMNYAQLEQLEQVRELDAEDYENETAESRLLVVEVRHEADWHSDNTAEVADITLLVAPAPAELLPDQPQQ